MAKGELTHPSYLTRQVFGLGVNAAGSGGLGNKRGLPFAIRAHVPVCAVQTIGTTAVNIMGIICVGTYTLTANGTATTTSGTNTIGSVTVSTAAVNTTVSGTDMNITINAGSVVYVKGGTDALAVCETSFDYALDPVLGTWTGV